MLWLLAAALLAQTPETVREADVFAAGVDVEVVNVDVVVSDRQGRPVTGLGPEDFELRVDGESVAVRYFAAPAPAEARPRERPLYLAIYLDRAFLRPGDAGDLVPALRRFLHERIGRRDRVMLVAADRGVEVVQGWTSLVPAIDTSLGEELAKPGRGLRVESDYRDLLRAIERTLEEGTDLAARDPDQHAKALLSRIDGFAEECARDVRLGADQLRQTVAGLAGVPGRTVVLYVGGQLPVRVGPALFDAWQSAFGRKSARWQTPATPGAGGGAPGTGTTGFESIQAPAAELDGGELFGRVAQLASANGVRFYALQADSLRASAAAASTRGNLALARESGGAQWDLGRTQGAASRRAFEELAEATGGRALAGSRDFDAALGAGAGAHRARRDPRRARPSPRIHARGRRRARRPDGGGGRARRLRAAALDPRRAAGVVARRPGTGAVEVR